MTHICFKLPSLLTSISSWHSISGDTGFNT